MQAHTPSHSLHLFQAIHYCRQLHRAVLDNKGRHLKGYSVFYREVCFIVWLSLHFLSLLSFRVWMSMCWCLLVLFLRSGEKFTASFTEKKGSRNDVIISPLFGLLPRTREEKFLLFFTFGDEVIPHHETFLLHEETSKDRQPLRDEIKVIHV